MEAAAPLAVQHLRDHAADLGAMPSDVADLAVTDVVPLSNGGYTVAYVQQQLIAARDAGAAVLVISDDLEEEMTLGDRIAVMHHGHLTPALPAEAWTRESIGLAMAGHGSGHAA